jgi:putative membrane protein
MRGRFLPGCARRSPLWRSVSWFRKFDLFLRIAAGSLNAQSPSVGSQIVGNIAGLLLIVLGGAMMALAGIRFRKTTRDIDAKEVRPGPGEQLDITLFALLLLLGAIFSSRSPPR